MPSTSVLATAEGLPSITRRHAFAAASTVVAVALIGEAGAAPVTAADRIAEHASACRRCQEAWEVVECLEPDIAHPKIQYGRLLLGRNSDGTDEFEPLYAYTEEAIVEQIDKSKRVSLTIWGRDETTRAAIAAKHNDRLAGLLADFRSQVQEAKAIEEACGYTAARLRANALDSEASAGLEAIIRHEFRSVEEVRNAAAYLIAIEASGAHVGLVDFVKVLAGVP